MVLVDGWVLWDLLERGDEGTCFWNELLLLGSATRYADEDMAVQM